MGFTVINEKFVCKKCGEKNPPVKGSCRNHCKKCLYSMHRDEIAPGDRLSECRGLMEPVSSYQSGKKGWMIMHKCLDCKKEIANRMADDDNFDIVIRLSQPKSLKS